MEPCRYPRAPKLANCFALFAIVALLFSGLAVPAAQAAPDAPDATTVIAALSDYGSGTTLEQTVADMIASWSPAWIVTAGDNYHYQSCNSYATCVGAYYGTFVSNQTFMPTMGNHDYDSVVGLTAWNTYFTWLPTDDDPQRRRYDFVAGDVHFFMLDGNRDRYTQSAWDNQTAWLQSTAAASTSTWKIAILHQAPYSTGYYGDIAASQLPYGQYGIDFVISGHNHHFERLVKADGGKTVRYFIDGYGGSLPTGLGHSECGTSTSTATSEFCLANTPGAIKITASDTSITFEYYNSSGVLQHTYTQDANEECATVNLVATEDNYLSAANVQYNNGGSTELHVDATTGTSRRTSLMKWDVSSIPANAVVSSASFSLNVSDASPLVFNLYNMRRAWVEGTGNRTNSTTSSNWNTYDGAANWGTAGAANVDSDRYDTNLWSAGTTSFSTTGSKTEALNAEGVGVVQGWIDGTVDNHGLIMQNYSGSTSNAVFFASSENATTANRPRLNVTYCVVAGPTITTSGALAPFSTTPGAPSAAQTYTVSGRNLTEDITITAPAGFEISTDGTSYYSSRTLAQSGGTVPATTVWVRLTGAAGTWSGDIVHTSTNATARNVAVSGTAGWCSTVSFQQGADGYAGARDAHIRQANATYNYGATTPLMVDSDEPYNSSNDMSALLYWDLSTIPTGSTVDSASVTVYVENVTESPGYNLYAMMQAWTEGTGNGSATGNGATWNTYDGTNAWPGGAGGAGASDRSATVLANFAATSTGSHEVSLGGNGLDVLESWVNTPADNKGFMIHAGSTSNGLDFTSKEGTTVANRPKLTISYCTPPPAALPKAPEVTSIVLSGSDVVLGWDEVTLDVSENPTDIMAYRVYGSHDPFFDPAPADLLGATTDAEFTYTHTGGSTGSTNWYYLVRAVNAVGESANSPRRTGRFGFVLVPGALAP